MLDDEAWPNDPVLARVIVATIACDLDDSSWEDRQLLLMDLCCAAWPSARARNQ